MLETPKGTREGRREWCAPQSWLLQRGPSSVDAKSCGSASMAWGVLSTGSPSEAVTGFLAGDANLDFIKQIPTYTWLDTAGGNEATQAMKI